MLYELGDMSGKSVEQKIEMMENHLRVNGEYLEYMLTHLDSSNITEIDISKTRIYEGEDN